MRHGYRMFEYYFNRHCRRQAHTINNEHEATKYHQTKFLRIWFQPYTTRKHFCRTLDTYFAFHSLAVFFFELIDSRLGVLIPVPLSNHEASFHNQFGAHIVVIHGVALTMNKTRFVVFVVFVLMVSVAANEEDEGRSNFSPSPFTYLH